MTSSINPLCLLLGGLLSQDRNQVQNAMREIRDHILLQPTDALNLGRSSAERNVNMVVSAVLKRNPTLASNPCEEEGNLPLHYAAALGYADVGRLLLNQFPGAAACGNRKGKIPLHFAAREGRTMMVSILLNANPKTAQIPSKKGKLALHFAVGEGHTAIVERLLKVYPQGALKPSSKGKLPLHFAARWGHMTIARNLIALHPESVRTLDWEASLPLHDASRQGQVAMARFLMEKFPQGLATASLRGEIPLFSAVRSGNLDLVIYLVQAWPSGASYVLQNLSAHDSVEDWNPAILELCLRGLSANFTNCTVLQGRRVPVLCNLDHVIHTEGSDSDTESQNNASSSSSSGDASVAFSRTGIAPVAMADATSAVFSGTKRAAAPQEVVRRSKRIRRERLNIPASHGRNERFLALHAALSSGTNTQVIRHVLRTHRQQVTERDSLGQFPLHVAMANSRGEDEYVQLILDEILQAHPNAASTRDRNGHLPLHVGLLARADFRLVQGVVEANPECGGEPFQVERGGLYKLPLFVAAANDCDLSTVYHLLRYDPSVIRVD